MKIDRDKTAIEDRTLVGGMYRCLDCGHIVEVTKLDQCRVLGARIKTKESFYAKCPKCYHRMARRRHNPATWNVFDRMGLWATVKESMARVWRDDNAQR